MKISILGAGSWSTAIANVLADKNEILLYARDKDQARKINEEHINYKYFPDISLSKNIKASSRLEDIFENEYIINGIPTQNIRSVLEKSKGLLKDDHVIINLSKGLELTTYKRISQIFKDYNENIHYAVLSGPSHAEEVVKKMPTTLVCASKDKDLSKKLQEMFMRDYLRVYYSTDVVGVELGGAIKNILALGIGMATGLKYGDNAKAALITRGISEMTRFSKAFGADSKTINGLAGIGDLIVTATSRHSRNNRAGILIGQGFSIDELQKEINMVVEGIPTTKAIYEISKNIGVELPITNEIYQVLFKNKPSEDSVRDLMMRDMKSEF